MSQPPDAPFLVDECARCGAVTLAGRVHGLRYRVDRHTLLRAEANMLTYFGVPVLVLTRRPAGGVWGDHWTPDHDLTHPDRHLVAPHICGSAHATRKD